jgi:hypothetical protein
MLRGGSRNNRSFFDLGGRHLPCDVLHLLADVVAPCAGRYRRR